MYSFKMEACVHLNNDLIYKFDKNNIYILIRKYKTITL